MSSPAHSKRLNVLVYAGTGSTTNSVRHATFSLRQVFGPNKAVVTVTADQILKEPWTETCALLVMPGGADLGYCRTLNGEGNRRIRQFVETGGAYLGLCAGGYYGCSRCEFEVGKKAMEVVGDRELGFYPGVCRGLAFPGFVYQSEAGARAVELKVNRNALKSDAKSDAFRSYYNGGGVFVDAEKFQSQGVEVLASYAEENLAVDAGEGNAAVVFCKVGGGGVILTGPHPEFFGRNLNPKESSGHASYPALVDALVADEQKCTHFFRACMAKLGLEVDDRNEPVPALSLLHLSSVHPSDVAELVHSWHEAGIVTKGDDGEEFIRGENDTFALEQSHTHISLSMASVAQAVKNVLPSLSVSASASVSHSGKSSDPVKLPAGTSIADRDRIPDYNAQIKHLVPHESSLPTATTTPQFDHAAYFAHLAHYQSISQDTEQATWGKILLYGETVTSTNTLLEKNVTLLSHLPTGFTATATTQVAGRGRGTNVWVSPPGSLMFSVVLRHPLANTKAPVVFIQYLAALAIVAGIKNYTHPSKGDDSNAGEKSYASLPVKLKWPNDIYALSPSTTSSPLDPSSPSSYAKIGGILVNTSYSGGDYTLVVGVGLNVNNSRPSMSLAQLCATANLPAPSTERLLASILAHFEPLYIRFCRTGFDAALEAMYYTSWLHTDQVVTVEAGMVGGPDVGGGPARARIRGITRDWGMLVAEEMVGERSTGRKWQLQSDSNSFDFFQGLVRRKM